MVHRTGRNTRRFSSNSGRFCNAGQLTDGCGSFGSHVHVHLPYGFSSIKLTAVTAAGAQFGPLGYEVDLLYLVCLAALVLAGPGPLAKGGLIRKRGKVRSSSSRPNLTPAAQTRNRTNAANS
jgi:hypothetical protein